MTIDQPGYKKSKLKPTSNPTSQEARELMTNVLERLAERDDDSELREKMKQRRTKNTQPRIEEP